MNTLMMITDINQLSCNFRGLTGEELPEEWQDVLKNKNDDMDVVMLHPKSFSRTGESIDSSCLPAGESSESYDDFCMLNEDFSLLQVQDGSEYDEEYLRAWDNWLESLIEEKCFDDRPLFDSTVARDTKSPSQTSCDFISIGKSRSFDQLTSIERRIVWGRSHGKRGGKRQKKFGFNREACQI